MTDFFTPAQRQAHKRDCDRVEALMARGDHAAATDLLTAIEHRVADNVPGFARPAARMSESDLLKAERSIEAYAELKRTGAIRSAATPGRNVDSIEYRAALGAMIAGRATAGLREVAEAHYRRLSAAETRDLGVGTGSAGGYTVPQGFLHDLYATTKLYSAVERVARVVTAEDGRTSLFPRVDDTANPGHIIGENVPETELDMVFASTSIPTFMYSSGMQKISWQLMTDAGVDVVSALGGLLGVRIGRVSSTHFVSGNGTTQPQGILNGKTGDVTTASTTLTHTDLLTLVNSLDPSYSAGGKAAWLMHPNVAQTITQLADTTNARPLFLPNDDPRGNGSSLMGWPVVLSPDMPSTTAATTQNVVAFGDFSQGYVIRKDDAVSRLVVLKERFADQLQTGLIFASRMGAVQTGVASYKTLTMHA